MKILLTILFTISLAQIVQKQTKDLEKDILAYWTPERMKNAIPIPLPIVKHNRPNNTFSPFFSTQQVPVPLSTPPYRMEGKLFLETPRGGASCTATAVGNNAVLTAGHCVHDGSTGFYSNFMFVPQYQNGMAPVGVWTASYVWTLAAWAYGGGTAFASDVGVLQVSSQNGATLQNVVGSVSPIYNTNGAMNAMTLGYPANIGGGNVMIQSTGTQSVGDTAYNPPTLKLPSTMTFGASGGGCNFF